MKAWRSFLVSLGGSNLRLAAYGWAANALFGALLFCAFQRWLGWRIGRSLAGASIGERGLFTFFSDLTAGSDSGPVLLLGLGVGLLLAFGLLTVFLSAGWYAVLVRGGRVTLAGLYGASRECFGRLLRQALVNLLVWAPAALASLLALWAAMRLNDRLGGESGLEALLWGWAGLTLLAAGMASAVADFAKIFRLRGEANGWLSLWRSLRFVFSRPGSVLLLLLVYLLASLVLNAAAWLALGSWPRLAGLPLGALLAALQSVVFGKYYLKAALARAQLHLLANP